MMLSKHVIATSPGCNVVVAAPCLVSVCSRVSTQPENVPSVRPRIHALRTTTCFIAPPLNFHCGVRPRSEADDRPSRGSRVWRCTLLAEIGARRMLAMRAHRMAALPAIALAACAAPSRQLTPRIVEDPITLPRRMASASLAVTAVHFEPTDAYGFPGTPGFRFGITDHLEWVDLLGLRYAFLDDRPADGRARMPISLA